MLGSRRDDLEARVARLERLLERVLALVQDLQREKGAEAPGSEPHRLRPEALTAEREVPTAEAVPWKVGPEPPEAGPGPTPGPGLRPEPALPGHDPGTGPEPGPGPEPRPQPGPEPEPSRPGGPRARPWSEDPYRFRFRPGSPGILADLGSLASGGTLLGRVGIALLILSVAFFFKYSIDQGWLTEWVRLVMGGAAGVILAALGFRGAAKGEPLGTVLAGGGIAVFFITGFVGHQWYGLISYPVAFGFLVGASALGIVQALVSGRQTLAIAGLIGALVTPLILTSPDPKVAGLALYVSLIVASVAALYMARGWRLVLLLAVVTAWLALSPAVAFGGDAPEPSTWVVQGAVAFCALVFWLVPLLRAGLRAGNPERWPRPEGGIDRWSAHLDALSLTMPLVGILMSAWLWDLSRMTMGWGFLGTALLAWGIGALLSRTPDPEGSADTQRFVSILLSTVGLGLVLTGDLLYLVFIAEAAALLIMGARKESWALLGLGGAVELVVVALFLMRLALAGTLLEGDVSSVFDLAAVGGAVLIGTRLDNRDAQLGFFIGAYLGFLAFLGRELAQHPAALYLAFVLVALGTQWWAASRKSGFLSALGHVPAFLFATLFWTRLNVDSTLWAGDASAWVDLAAVVDAAVIGTLLTDRQGRQLYLLGAYLALLAWTARELLPFEQGQAYMSLAFGIEGTALLVAGWLTERVRLRQIGMATLLLVVGKVLLVDLASVEPIWRVLLLFLFALLFLVLSKFVQIRRPSPGEAPE